MVRRFGLGPRLCEKALGGEVALTSLVWAVPGGKKRRNLSVTLVKRLQAFQRAPVRHDGDGPQMVMASSRAPMPTIAITRFML
jgi:hypothetical protein